MTNIATPAGRERVRRMDGKLNIDPTQRLANISSAIRRGLPQFRAYPPTEREACIVGSGPSLASTLDEIKALKESGAAIFALNAAHEWLLEQGIVPSAAVVIDARPFNARFVKTPAPNCAYMIASQCAPETFDMVAGRRAYIWHCLTGDDPIERDLLDGYYLGSWQPVAGGCTVGTRTIVLTRMLGYQKMHLFGMDSCYMDGQGHIMPQPENDADGAVKVECEGREFMCTVWHCEQALEFIDLIATNGEHFQLSVHGDGLLAHILSVGGADDGLVDKLEEGAQTCL